MNWLAHLYLSEPTDAFRIGNLLPDLVSPDECRHLPPEFVRGIECHRRIDKFTDAHPVVKRTIGRLDGSHRRFGGIIVDVVYDHFLAHNWKEYSVTPLDDFTREVYAGFVRQRELIPESARERLDAMRVGDWLGSYRELGNICIALERIGSRLSKPRDLSLALMAVEQNYEAWRDDFREFFPELTAHVNDITSQR